MQSQPESAGFLNPRPVSAHPGQPPRRASARPRPFRRCPRSRLASLLLLVLGLATGPLVLSVPPVLAQESPAVAASIGVNINTATAAELAAGLSGVGASRAEAIVRYREQFGPFESIEELIEVSGIGSATVERNRERLLLR